MRSSPVVKVTSYRREGEDQDRSGVVFPPRRPSRRASAPLSRYDRLAPDDQPETARVRLEGMERLRAALDALAVKMNEARPSLDEVARAMSDVGRASGAGVRYRDLREQGWPHPPRPAQGRR